MAVPAAHPAPGHSIRRAQAPDFGEAGLDRPSPWAAAAWRVREDRAFYVTDVMSDWTWKANAELYRAANEHARHLHRAQRRLEDVLNLAGVLRASIGDKGDNRAMQAEAVLKTSSASSTRCSTSSIGRTAGTGTCSSNILICRRRRKRAAATSESDGGRFEQWRGCPPVTSLATAGPITGAASLNPS